MGYISVPILYCDLGNFTSITVADPGFPIGGGGGADLFSAKTYVKTKEMDPVGGGVCCQSIYRISE